MAKIRVDYSELVKAIQSGDDGKASTLLAEIIPRLEEYLQVAMKAEPDDAAECVQEAFLDVFDQIRKGNINTDKLIFSYLIKASRHEYYRYAKKQHKFNFDFDMNEVFEPEQQLKRLIDEERQQILIKCLAELEDDTREFISYFIAEPDATTNDAVNKFKITSSAVRTRKSRVLSKLHHCYKRKSSE